MKKILAIILCLITLFSFVACGCSNQAAQQEQNQQGQNQQQIPVQIINVAGNTYKVDLTTLNIAWEEDKEPSEVKKNDFMSSIKEWYKDSQITFDSEYSFVLSGTNNALYDLDADDCLREDNELYKEFRLRGNVDIMVYDDRVVFLCDFFLKGWGMYLSIDYLLVK